MNEQHKKSFGVGLALWLAVAQAQTPPSTQRITPNFQNVDISVLADAVGQATGTSFVLDQRVRGTVNLVNPRPMTPQELYQTFLSILQVNGFIAVRSGQVVKIVPETSMRQMPGTDLPATVNPNSDEVVSTLIQADNISAQQLNTALRPLISQNGNLAQMPGTNALMIKDRASNVASIQKLVAAADKLGGSGVDMVRLENATADDVVRALSTLVTGQPGDTGGNAPRLVADSRTNSVLISGDPATRLRVAAYVTKLDTELPDGGGTETLYLKYTDAQKLADKLKQQATGIAAAATGGAANTAAAAAADRSVSIWADQQTNALIITAPPKMMRQLKDIVDKLDIPRKQVLIEAIIADVSMDKSSDLGVNWAVYSNKDGSSIPAGAFASPVGSANNNPVSIIDLANAIANPASAATVPLGATFGIGQLKDNGLSFGAMIRALVSDTNTNVVASPTQITADNEEADLESGQEVPFITGQYTNTGTTTAGAVNPFTTVQRQQIGTKLKITPQLNGEDAMTLTIDLESSELAGASGDAGSAITNVRKFHNVVLIKDQQWIVVGGLIRDSKIAGETRVPFLGRIPLLGELFKVRNAKRTKANLMVFIKPTILVDSVQTTIATTKKYSEIRDQQLQQRERGEVLPLLPGDKPPLLPPAETPPAQPATTPPAPPGATSAPASGAATAAPVP